MKHYNVSADASAVLLSRGEARKPYDKPMLEVIRLEACDIITTSGEETPILPETDGIWDLDIG